MDLEPFKLDIDELINEFAEGGFTKLVELKGIWISRKFSFIFEASPTTNQACFMQSLFAHSIGYMVGESSLSHRLGGLYCLYCLFQTQPFKPPFKIYLSLGELKRFKNLIVHAKQEDIKVVCSLAKHMLQRNMFLFGFVDRSDGSSGRLNELTDAQNARVQVAYKKLFANTQIEDFIHMDLGRELDVDLLKRKSSSYAAAKELAIREAGDVVDVENIRHTTENTQLIGDVVENTAETWNTEKVSFYQQTGVANGHSKQQKSNDSSTNKEDGNLIAAEDNEITDGKEAGNDDDDFGMELEVALLCAP